MDNLILSGSEMILFLLPEVVNTVCHNIRRLVRKLKHCSQVKSVFKDLDDFGHFDSRAESE